MDRLVFNMYRPTSGPFTVLFLTCIGLRMVRGQTSLLTCIGLRVVRG